MTSVAGEIVVVGVITGTHIIEDIGIAVPHKVAVNISAELALRSKDLHRGIQQGKIFMLDGGSGIRAATTPTSDHNRVAQLEAENARLKQELDAEKLRNQGLQDVLAGFGAQLQGLNVTLGRLGDRPPQGIQMHGSVPMALGTVAPEAAPGVVGGEVPTFLPERIRPDAAESQIRPAMETAEKSNVTSAASKLRELKKGTG